MLSERLLTLLRDYWRAYRPAPSGPLFPGKGRGGVVNHHAIRRALEKAVRACSLRKHVTPHVLRHYPDCRIIPRWCAMATWRAAPVEPSLVDAG